MKKVAALALAAGMTACSGGHAISLLPHGGSSQGTGAVRHARSAPAGWSATGTDTFSLANATDAGLLPAAQTLTVRVGLALHSVAQLQSLVASGQTMSPGAFAASFGPTQSDVQSVTAYLQKQGFTNVSVEPNNLLVSATGTAAQASAAFNTTLHAFSTAAGTVYANTSPAYVPQSLGGIVVAVLGLNNAQTFKTKPHPESPCAISSVSLIGLPSPQPEPSPVGSTAGCLRNYTPSDYWRAYDVGSVPKAGGVNVAIMAEGNVQPAIADFRTNENGFGLPQVPVVVKQVGLASPDTAGDDEWTLDMTASSGMAGAVRTLYVYDTTSLTDSDIALEYNRWVTDDLAPIGNSSFGGCEFGPYLDGSMLVDDEIMLQGAAQGQTMFASSGDTGSFCSVGTPNGVPAGAPLVEYPAASPYVVAVGGTTLDTAPDGSYQGESAWDAGGGGISQFEYSPSWQNGVQPASSTPVGLTFRGVPDIAMDADLQTGMVLYTASTGWTVIGGTSLASPLAAGVWARMLQGHPSRGYAASRLYHAWSASAAGTQTVGPPPTQAHGPFHDVLSGANGAYTALPGYDYTTGMGSLDVTALAAAAGS